MAPRRLDVALFRQSFHFDQKKKNAVGEVFAKWTECWLSVSVSGNDLDQNGQDAIVKMLASSNNS